ncbi:hypothetical protein FZC80_04055 [Rossellomorea aquimaris]|uniref:Uncharacterized protein n=1 Tax=Rossellomorea aquimaris TaxID=189382 RepID=A0A5D4U6F1_9BACI|nr:hypothetical protein FZC80_04055 [Rossellomorea aquimaris]
MRPQCSFSPSGSNNLKRIKGKTAFFSLENICLSGLTKALPLFIKTLQKSLVIGAKFKEKSMIK